MDEMQLLTLDYESNGLFPPMETETDSHTDYCTKQVFSTGMEMDSNPLIKI